MYVIYKKDLTQSEAQNLSYTILKNLYYLSHPILQKHNVCLIDVFVPNFLINEPSRRRKRCCSF